MIAQVAQRALADLPDHRALVDALCARARRACARPAAAERRLMASHRTPSVAPPAATTTISDVAQAGRRVDQDRVARDEQRAGVRADTRAKVLR
jgi:hypothetical protein